MSSTVGGRVESTACCRRGMEVIERRVEDIPPQSQKVDVAVAFEVIEHLFAPRLFLSAMAAQLVPGGLLVLTCPNGLGFDIEVLGPASLAVDAEHVNLFPRITEPPGFRVRIRGAGNIHPRPSGRRVCPRRRHGRPLHAQGEPFSAKGADRGVGLSRPSFPNLFGR